MLVSNFNNHITSILLSPILQTTHPGMGSALIQLPSKEYCFSIRSSEITGDTLSGRFENTCKAFGVGSAYRNLCKCQNYYRQM